MSINTRRAREPTTLHAGTLATPLGDLLLAHDALGRLRAAEFADREERFALSLDRRFGPRGYAIEPGRPPAGIADPLAAYFAGELGALQRIPYETGGTPFQQAVWRALAGVEPGAAISYGVLAARIGRPAAARAVGHANGSNPLTIVVPCHRLVGSDGDMTGYGGGLARKEWLLRHEQRHAASRAIPEGL